MSIVLAEDMIAANVNPRTGLATDYLNLFNEATMLFEMAFDMPEMVQELLTWQRRSYVQHFEVSGFEKREIVIKAYEQADAKLRGHFDNLCNQTCDAFEGAISRLLSTNLSDPAERLAGEELLSDLKSMVSLLDAQIHGRDSMELSTNTGEVSAEQAEVDALF